jgi:hypothetical protein
MTLIVSALQPLGDQAEERMQPFYRYIAPIRIDMKPSPRISTSLSRAGVIERTVATSEQT